MYVCTIFPHLVIDPHGFPLALMELVFTGPVCHGYHLLGTHVMTDDVKRTVVDQYLEQSKHVKIGSTTNSRVEQFSKLSK